MADILGGLYYFGRPLSPLYGLIMRLRTRLYRSGLLKSTQMDVPVISVGNLTMGGTGKTPFVCYIAHLLLENNFSPAIISRGYRGRSRERINIVSDGETVLMDPLQAGDEPVLLARTLAGVPILTGKIRALPCRYAITHFNSNVLILDDGFQHLAVARDLDLVLFNAASPLGNKRVFPGGDLREPQSSLQRAHAFVLTGVQDELRSHSENFRGRLYNKYPDKPVFFSSYTPFKIKSLKDHSLSSFNDIPSPVCGFCGIANPDRFYETLTSCGFKVNGFTALQDHQIYDRQLIKKIVSSAKENGARALITTEKDMVKLQSFQFSLPVYILTMTVNIEKTFPAFILEKVAQKNNLFCLEP